MKLKLGFSPCPNDTFIFDALVHNQVDTEGLEFEYILADVEELNQKAFRYELDISKVSYHAFLFLAPDYILLNTGSALGSGVGPLLVSKDHIQASDLAGKRVAIPGAFTTANLLLSLTLPYDLNRVEMKFSDIEDAVLRGEVDAGVIIHENRFTYQQRGLLKICDLGEMWELLTGKPIPLGGIAGSRRLPIEVLQKVDRSLARSIRFARTRKVLSEFVRCNAQEMSEAVMQQHIALYVNRYTEDLGEKGRDAICGLFDKAMEAGLISSKIEEIFLGR